jgi:hypothetical protein
MEAGREAVAWLHASREALLRRALALAVERSPLDDLARRPLGERLRDFDLVLEAAALEAGGEQRVASGRDALEAALDPLVAAGAPVAIGLLVAPPEAEAEAWARALAAAAAPDELVRRLGRGHVAAILRSGSAGEARDAVDRLRATAWAELGGRGPLPDAGVAAFPEDGRDARALIDAARGRLGGPVARPSGADEPAPTSEPRRGAGDADREAALRRALARWEDGAEAPAAPPPGPEGGLPPAPVRPLHPR